MVGSGCLLGGLNEHGAQLRRSSFCYASSIVGVFGLMRGRHETSVTRSLSSRGETLHVGKDRDGRAGNYEADTEHCSKH